MHASLIRAVDVFWLLVPLYSRDISTADISNSTKNILDGQTALHVEGNICMFDFGGELSL